jgi:glycosyltransferase involved in cell wall biosynthesis
MKIVTIHNRYVSTQPSGENDAVANEVAELINRGVQNQLVEMKSDDFLTLNPIRKLSVFVRSVVFGFSGVSKLQKNAIFGADLVHIHNTFPFFGYRLFATLDRKRIPIVLTVHNARLTCLNGSHLYRSVNCNLCPAAGNFHPGVLRKCYRNSHFLSFFYARYTSKIRNSISKVDKFVVLNDASRASLKELGIKPERIVQKFTPVRRPEIEVSMKSKNLLFAGRVSIDKGIGLLLKSWVNSGLNNSGWVLNIAGGGEFLDGAELSTWTSQGIQFHGFLKSEDLETLLAESDFVVVPSLGYEGFPTMISKAASMGKRVLASDIPSFQHLRNLSWVELIEPTEVAWSRSLASLQNEPNESFSADAQTWWQNNASFTSNSQFMLALYEGTLKKTDD